MCVNDVIKDTDIAHFVSQQQTRLAFNEMSNSS